MKIERIYVVCPAGVKTGGTELLHQLVCELNNIGKKAYITYYKSGNNNPDDITFREYVEEYKTIDDIVNDSTTKVIYPESNLDFALNFKNCKNYIWWMSVDNYYSVYTIKGAYSLHGFKGILRFIEFKRWRFKLSRLNSIFCGNLAQSQYAVGFLNKFGLNNVQFLSDYINQDYIGQCIDTPRENIILYNPKKGIEFTKKLMNVGAEFTWIPLVNMNTAQIKENLLKAKVYIDFGNHPGKDRFPREAAVCGCCVITGKRGSAKYDEDVPIDGKYKFDDIDDNLDAILDTIKECFNNYDERVKDFKGYRDFIQGEKNKFEKDVRRVFEDCL